MNEIEIVRREFWANASALYGLPLSPAQLDEAAGEGDDVVVVDRLFPQLGDVERSEVLWALGAHLRDRARCDEVAA